MRFFVLLYCVLITNVAVGQSTSKEKLYKAKQQLRAGNKAYEKNNFLDAAIAYQKSLDVKGDYYKGAYNLGNTYFNQKKYKEALEQYQLANKLAKSKVEKATTYESLGDTYQQQKKTEEAFKAYKQALLKNPKDDDLRQKFIAARQQKQEQQKNKDDKKKQDKKKDDKKNKDDKKKNKKDTDKNKGENPKDQKDKNNKGENKDQEKSNKEKESQDQKEKDQKGNGENPESQDSNSKEQKGEGAQPKKSKLSKQQIERLLETMSNEEQKTQKKVNAQKIKMKTNKTEKDW